GYGGTGGSGRSGDDDEAGRLSDDLSAGQLARVQVGEDGLVSNVSGLTQSRPPIAVTVNRRQHVIVVRTIDEEAMAQIERLVLDLARPTPQVLLEVKVLELELGDDFRAALDVDLVSGPERANIATGEPTNPLVQGATTVAAQVIAAGNAPFAG